MKAIIMLDCIIMSEVMKQPPKKLLRAAYGNAYYIASLLTRHELSIMLRDFIKLFRRRLYNTVK